MRSTHQRIASAPLVKSKASRGTRASTSSGCWSGASRRSSVAWTPAWAAASSSAGPAEVAQEQLGPLGRDLVVVPVAAQRQGHVERQFAVPVVLLEGDADGGIDLGGGVADQLDRAVERDAVVRLHRRGDVGHLIGRG